MKESPNLLTDSGKVGIVHPVVIDEEDEVYCGGCGGDNANELGVWEVCKRDGDQLHWWTYSMHQVF